MVGSGGVEENIDLILCRRFKGRGMSRSRAGDQNLLKLRLLRYDRKAWKVYWPAKSELKPISGGTDVRQKILCPRWAEILLEEKLSPI